jgi:hypothetical protein
VSNLEYPLGRRPEFDERSRSFAGVDLLPRRAAAGQIRGRAWRIVDTFDQSKPLVNVPNWDAIACTGFSCGYDLIASPAPAKWITPEVCFAIYQRAKTLDDWPGENYEGSSVLAAAKAATEMGYIGEYHWAFGIDDALQCLSWLGPIVVGTDWLNSMFEPQPNGLIEVNGEKTDVAGGHAYMFRSIILNRNTQAELLGKGVRIRNNTPLLRLHQSWGKTWGINNGEALMWADDLEKLLKGVAYPGECRITTAPLKKAA